MLTDTGVLLTAALKGEDANSFTNSLHANSPSSVGVRYDFVNGEIYNLMSGQLVSRLLVLLLLVCCCFSPAVFAQAPTAISPTVSATFVAPDH